MTQRAPNTGTSTYARKSWSGHPWVIWHRKVPPSGLWLCGSASTWQWLLRARKERRGLLVVTGTTGRTSCGTPERLRPSIHYPLYATAHSAARANHHVPHWCCILAVDHPRACPRCRVETRGGRSGSRLDGYAMFPGTTTRPGGTVVSNTGGPVDVSSIPHRLFAPRVLALTAVLFCSCKVLARRALRVLASDTLGGVSLHSSRCNSVWLQAFCEHTVHLCSKPCFRTRLSTTLILSSSSMARLEDHPSLCSPAFIFFLTPCLRAVGEMLGPVWISDLRLFVFAT